VFAGSTANSKLTAYITLLSVLTGERRKLSDPAPGTLGDHGAVFPPDGARIAFVQYKTSESSELFVLGLNGSGPPKALENARHGIALGPFQYFGIWPLLVS
jgi:hypothetical protein